MGPPHTCHLDSGNHEPKLLTAGGLSTFHRDVTGTIPSMDIVFNTARVPNGGTLQLPVSVTSKAIYLEEFMVESKQETNHGSLKKCQLINHINTTTSFNPPISLLVGDLPIQPNCFIALRVGREKNSHPNLGPKVPGLISNGISKSWAIDLCDQLWMTTLF